MTFLATRAVKDIQMTQVCIQGPTVLTAVVIDQLFAQLSNIARWACERVQLFMEMYTSVVGSCDWGQARVVLFSHGYSTHSTSLSSLHIRTCTTQHTHTHTHLVSVAVVFHVQWQLLGREHTRGPSQSWTHQVTGIHKLLKTPYPCDSDQLWSNGCAYYKCSSYD